MKDKSSVKAENLNGVYKKIAAALDVETAMKIHSVFRGQQVFFPVELFGKDYIRERIVAEYNGKNVKQLATKYGYTEKWIKRIIKEYSEKFSKTNE
ncbi:MAG: Mor transcription activator family protein [Oscillospiraceae bacterium]|nr:Mor transcription activator family protein [Oscillospiraceae bacterium]